MKHKVNSGKITKREKTYPGCARNMLGTVYTTTNYKVVFTSDGEFEVNDFLQRLISIKQTVEQVEIATVRTTYLESNFT